MKSIGKIDNNTIKVNSSNEWYIDTATVEEVQEGTTDKLISIEGIKSLIGVSSDSDGEKENSMVPSDDVEIIQVLDGTYTQHTGTFTPTSNGWLNLVVCLNHETFPLEDDGVTPVYTAVPMYIIDDEYTEQTEDGVYYSPNCQFGTSMCCGYNAPETYAGEEIHIPFFNMINLPVTKGKTYRFIIGADYEFTMIKNSVFTFTKGK